MSNTKQEEERQGVRDKFVKSANEGKILANRCTNCGHYMLETVYFCEKCGKNSFEAEEINGIGTVVTYTILAVAPEGFEDAGSYAWVVFKLKDKSIRASGFLSNIANSADLPIGSRVTVTGYDEKHGLILKKLD
ncbi:MAG TPA: OB-fold domain-containing protein [Nitrososphaeraceae archaeon]